MSDKIEKSFETVMKVDGEELYRTIETVSVEMVDHQFEMIMQVVNNTYGNTTYRAITLDKKKLQQALINATPIQPHFSFEDNHAHCGTCYEELKSGYSFCPACGRKIKWKYCNDSESMIQ